MHYAASLSFHSVLSLIPLLLISLGIFTKLPAFEHYFNKLKEFIFESLLPSNQEQIASYIETFLTNIGSLGIFGFLAVGFTSIMFFGDYIFVIKNLTNAAARGFWRTFSIYWTTMTLMPIALAFSFYLAATIQRTFDLQASGINLVAFLPNLIIWAIFCFTYSITINREMKLRNILLASFSAHLLGLSPSGFLCNTRFTTSLTKAFTVRFLCCFSSCFGSIFRGSSSSTA